MERSTHENFASDDPTGPSSERSFSIVMAAALSGLGTINWWHDGRVWSWLLGAAAGFLVVGYFFAAALKPLNWIWFKFGLLLHSVVNPVIMGLVFYGAVLPTGIAMRAMGKDLLRLKAEPEFNSYWIKREPPGPAPETMKDQF